MKTAKTPDFFHDKPLFGLDIGHNSLKVMQLEQPEGPAAKNHLPRVVGYGFTTFDDSAQKDGMVVKPDVIAKAVNDLFKKGLLGDISTRRVAMALPAYRTFTRSVQVPNLPANQLKEAVELEAEQYISLPLDELYLDYEIIKQTAETTELFVVAVPRKIVDSYLDLAHIMGLEAVLIEPTLSSSGRLFSISHSSDEAAIIIDFGSVSSDISIYDKHTLVTGTVQGGGIDFTNAIKNKLDVTFEEAGRIKTRYGLGVSKRQSEIRQSIEPTMEQIIKEIRRMMRYYEERYGSTRQVSQVLTLGGGANMPGLSDYFTQSLRLAVRYLDPWHYLDYKNLQPPPAADRPMYTTVVGLSLANPKELFRS